MTETPEPRQQRPRICPWDDPLLARLPGLRPIALEDWLLRDEAFAAQMAMRDACFHNTPDAFAEIDGSLAAQSELLALVRVRVASDPGYAIAAGIVTRPDEVAVDIAGGRPLLAAARLVQEDLLLLDIDERGRPVLVAGALAFPASWSLHEKIGRPLSGIHKPVARISPEMDTRLDRLLQRLPPGAPVERCNALLYNDPAPRQPRREGEQKPFDPEAPVYVRIERQCLMRLPESGAIVFSIHTSVTPRTAMPEEDQRALQDYMKYIRGPA